MRLKIILGNLLVVLVVGLGSYSLVRTEVDDSLQALLAGEMSHAGPIFSRTFESSALELVADVQEQANTATLRGVFMQVDGNRRRERAFSACESVESWFSDPARGRDGKPEIVVVTDAAGALVARSSSVNLLIEDDLTAALPSLSQVLRDGVPRHDVWDRPDSGLLLQVGIAPIRGGDGAVLGGLVVGYDLSNGVASAQAAILGRDVAFLTAARIYSSSLDSTTSGELQSMLFGESELARHTAAAIAGDATSPWRRTVGGRDVMGVTGQLPMARSVPVGFVVLADRAAYLAPTGAVNWILVMMGLGMVAVVVYGLMLAVSLIRPLEDIEEAVLAVINGQTDVRVDVEGSELGGLAYRINQLINELTGVAEDTGDGVQRRSADDWREVREDTGRVSAPPSLPHAGEDSAPSDGEVAAGAPEDAPDEAQPDPSGEGASAAPEEEKSST